MADEAGIKITPRGATSLATGVFFILLFAIITGLIAGMLFPLGFQISDAIALLIVDLIVLVYLLGYPKKLYEIYRLKMKAGFIQAFMYMSIYLRDNPSFEGALSYAAENTKPPVSLALQKLLWNLESGKHTNTEEAMEEFLEPWKDEREITQTFQLLMTSVNQPYSRRLGMIDEAIRLLMDDFREKSRKFNRSMRVPLMALNAFGMFLPVMGMVMLPVVFIFMGTSVSVSSVFIMYDIALPFILLFFIDKIINSKPVSFEPPRVPSDPPVGWFSIGKPIPAWYAGAAILIIGFVVSHMLWSSSNMAAAGLFVLMFGASIFATSYLSVAGREGIRDAIKKMEEEFGISLFNLGNEIANGYSFEVAVRKSLANMKKLKIRELFQRLISNLESGMTLNESLFNKQNGALEKFPSDMIRTVMQTILKSLAKGSHALSMLMVGISKYIKEISDAEENIREVLGEVTSSVKFQATILNPVLIGSLTAMTKLMLSIVKQINRTMRQAAQQSSMPMPTSTFSNVVVSTGDFIIITGIYLVESATLLSYFTTILEDGFDKIQIFRNTARTVAISLIVYIITLLITSAMFGSFSLPGV